MDACINVIERFLSQYADVNIAFYSDNGTNFHGTLIFMAPITQLKACTIKTSINNFNATIDPNRFHGTLTLLMLVPRVGSGSVLFALSGAYFVIYLLILKSFLLNTMFYIPCSLGLRKSLTLDPLPLLEPTLTIAMQSSRHHLSITIPLNPLTQ